MSNTRKTAGRCGGHSLRRLRAATALRPGTYFYYIVVKCQNILYALTFVSRDTPRAHLRTRTAHETTFVQRRKTVRYVLCYTFYYAVHSLGDCTDTVVNTHTNDEHLVDRRKLRVRGAFFFCSSSCATYGQKSRKKKKKKL